MTARAINHEFVFATFLLRWGPFFLRISLKNRSEFFLFSKKSGGESTIKDFFDKIKSRIDDMKKEVGLNQPEEHEPEPLSQEPEQGSSHPESPEQRKRHQPALPRKIPGMISKSDKAARLELIEQVEAMFGEFGPAIASYMLSSAMSEKGIQVILQKLDLHTRGRVGADMAQIEAWILANGVEEFRRAVGIRERPTPAKEPRSDSSKQEQAETKKQQQSPKQNRPRARRLNQSANTEGGAATNRHDLEGVSLNRPGEEETQKVDDPPQPPFHELSEDYPFRPRAKPENDDPERYENETQGD